MQTVASEEKPMPVQGSGADKGLLSKLETALVMASKVLFWIASAGLVSMLLLIVADVIGIKWFKSPIPGGIEIVSLLAVTSIAFAVPYTQVMRGHVAVDFIVERFPRRVRLAIDVVTTLLSVAVFGALAVYSFKYAIKLHDSGEVSMTQRIPYYPFVFGAGVCFVVTFLVLVGDSGKSIAKAAKTWSR